MAPNLVIKLSLPTCDDDVLLALLGHVDPSHRLAARSELYMRGYTPESINSAVGSEV